MRTLPLILMLIAGIGPLIAVVKAHRGWFLGVVAFIVGFPLHVVLVNTLMTLPAFRRMLSGPDAPAICLASVVSLIIIGLFSWSLYLYLARAKEYHSTIHSIYAILLAGLILIGVPLYIYMPESGYHAPKMPFVALIVAVALGSSGMGLLSHQNWARHLFIIVAPWASLALGSVFPSLLWGADAPVTVLLILLYIPLSFHISRQEICQEMNMQRISWVTRGGATVIAVSLAVLLARLIVVLQGHPEGDVGQFNDAELTELNRYVQHAVSCDVVLLNYFGALIAISVPQRKSSFKSKVVTMIGDKDFSHKQQSQKAVTAEAGKATQESPGQKYAPPGYFE